MPEIIYGGPQVIKSTALQSTANILASVAEIADTKKRADDLSTTSEMFDLQTKHKIKIAEFQRANLQNPNDKKAQDTLYKEINDGYNNIIGKSNSLSRKQFRINSQQMMAKTKSEVDIWSYNQTKKNAVVNFDNAKGSALQQAKYDGANLDDPLQSLSTFNDTAKTLIDDNNAIFYTPEEKAQARGVFAREYARNVMDGALQKNPLRAQELMKDKEFSSLLGDKTENYQNQINTRMTQYKVVERNKEIAGNYYRDKDMTDLAMAGNASTDEIETYISTYKVTPTTANYLRKINGIDKNGNKYKGGGTIKRNEKDKTIERANLIDDLVLLKTREGDELDFDDLSAKVNNVYSLGEQGYLTKSEVRSFVKKYDPYMSQATENRQLNDSTFTNSIWGDSGVFKIQSKIEDTTRRLKLDEYEDARLKDILYTDYDTEKSIAIKEFRRKDAIKSYSIDQTPLGERMLSDEEYFNGLSKSDRKEIEKQATDHTIKNYAENEFDIDTKNKTLLQIEREIAYGQGRHYQEMANLTFNYAIKKPFKISQATMDLFNIDSYDKIKKLSFKDKINKFFDKNSEILSLKFK